jgi:hypothetical protein
VWTAETWVFGPKPQYSLQSSFRKFLCDHIYKDDLTESFILFHEIGTFFCHDRETGFCLQANAQKGPQIHIAASGFSLNENACTIRCIAWLRFWSRLL